MTNAGGLVGRIDGSGNLLLCAMNVHGLSNRRTV